ncbi:hypothetical protein EOS_35835 [Caballeronia mineralivorans PML1(12)]|uniref:F-box domain-containing protein n=2 Tax=Caballeronia mineralivorans TaxID=2010198 RepID=A0A0J1CLS0_9BURK|nr:hypothetical protein EOS_35835 [Caballeronia mineralivorans PML1(12)]
MHLFGSSSPDRRAPEYRSTLNEKLPGRSLSRVAPANTSDRKAATLKLACNEIDKEINRDSSGKVISEYLKASLGYHGECGNTVFEHAALELSRNTWPWPFSKEITCSSVDLMVKIYISAVETEKAFTADGKLNDEDFIQFIVDHLDCEQTSPDKMRDRIPVRYRDRVILETDRRGQQASGPVLTNRTVRLNNIEFRLWIEPSSELERLPPEVLLHMVGCLSRPKDRLNLAAASQTMDRVLDRTARFDRLIGQASNIMRLRDVSRLLSIVADAISPGGREGGSGGLSLASWAKVLSVAVSRLWLVPYNERGHACVDILNVTLDLSRHHPDPVLLGITVCEFDWGYWPALGEIREPALKQIFTAAGGLSGAERAAVLSKLAVSIGEHPIRDDVFHEWKRAVFDELKMAAGDLLRNRPDPHAASLVGDLARPMRLLPAEERKNAVEDLFAMVDGWPDGFRAGVLADLVHSLLGDRGNALAYLPITVVKAIVDTIQTLPSAYRAEPLIALRYQIGRASGANCVQATGYVLDAVDGLDDADLSADLLTATPVRDVLRTMPSRKARFDMFERLLDITVRFLQVTPVEYAVLPLDHLSNAIQELHVGDEEAAYMMFAERVAPLNGGIAPCEGFFSSRIETHPEQTAKGIRKTLDVIGHYPPKFRVKALATAAREIRTMKGSTEDKATAIIRTLGMIESLPERDRVKPLAELAASLGAHPQDVESAAFDPIVHAVQDLQVTYRLRVLNTLNSHWNDRRADHLVAAVLSQ